MSIVNNANPGSQINLLCLIVSTLHRSQEKLNRDKLFDLCRPEKLLWNENSKIKFKREFDFWQKKEITLWKENENGYIDLVDFPSETCTVEDISKFVHSKLFAEIDDDFLRFENKDYAPLYRVLAFLNLIDTFHPFSTGKLSSDTLIESLASHFKGFLLNDDEKATFLEWCHFLGYLELVERTPKKLYVVDPTKAIMFKLKSIFDSVNEYHIRDFLSAIGKETPVLGFGSYSIKTKDILGNDFSLEAFNPDIPVTLSIALHRLVLEGKLRLLPGADDQNAMLLKLPSGSQLISKVVYTGRSS